MSHLMVVGKAMSAPDLVEEHVSSVLYLLKKTRGCMKREDVIAMIFDLRRAVGVLSDLREVLPSEK